MEADLSEFIQMIVVCYGLSHDEKMLKDNFEKYDLDGSGFLEAKEIKKFIKKTYEESMYDYFNIKKTPEFKEKVKKEVEKLIDDFDVNKDGKIDLSEFKEVMGATAPKIIVSMLKGAGHSDMSINSMLTSLKGKVGNSPFNQNEMKYPPEEVEKTLENLINITKV